MKLTKLLLISFIISLVACQSEEDKQEKNDGISNYTPPSFVVNPRTLAAHERALVGRWSTAFRDTKGNLVIPRQTEGSYLEYKADGTYRLYRQEQAIRVGMWNVNTQQVLEMKTAKNTKTYQITQTGGGLLEMTEQERGHKLVYVPYVR
ncbi:MAG: hypothetical protein MUE85_17910 [Microscillaceae bacterium]|jgi:hypothetical protein|nr:hypothetical protein [Microscillaceae bacterium]